jgi:hypothetical protein
VKLLKSALKSTGLIVQALCLATLLLLSHTESSKQFTSACITRPEVHCMASGMSLIHPFRVGCLRKEFMQSETAFGTAGGNATEQYIEGYEINYGFWSKEFVPKVFIQRTV